MLSSEGYFFLSGRRKDGPDSIDFELWTKFELRAGIWESFEMFESGGTAEVNYVPNFSMWGKKPVFCFCLCSCP